MPKTYTISAAYGLKVPTEADFSTQEARLGIEIELDQAENLDDAISELLVAETKLQLAVLETLAVPFTIDEASGAPKPDLTKLKRSAPAPSPNGGGGYQQRSSGNGQKGIEYPVVIDGVQRTVLDFRALKQSGQYKATAPNFKFRNPGQKDLETVWPTLKDKSVNPVDAEIARQIDALVSPM